LNNTKVIIFLIIAVLAVIIVIQQTSPQVTRAAGAGTIFERILNRMRLEEIASEDLFDLESARNFKEFRRGLIDETLKDLSNEAKFNNPNPNRLEAIRLKLNALIKEKGEINLAINKLNPEITKKKIIIKRLGEQIEDLGRRGRRLLGGPIRKLKSIKNPLIICVVGITYLCFDVDPAYAGFSTIVDPISEPPPTPPEKVKEAEEAIIPFIKFRSFPPTTPLPSTIP